MGGGARRSFLGLRPLAALLLAPALAAAQSMEPRAYSNLPVGLNILIVGYAYSEGALGFDASVPLQDGKTRVHAQAAAPASTGRRAMTGSPARARR
jgi:hypothetical protein